MKPLRRSDARRTHRAHNTADVLTDLESCSSQLQALCGDHRAQWNDDLDNGEASDSDTHSAAEIASECLALLESLSITGDNGTQDSEDDRDSIPQSPPSPHITETALLREINDLGNELEALMSALRSPNAEVETDEDQPKSDVYTDHSELEKSMSICTSPKMINLTKRLERRPSTQRMLVHTTLRRHRSFPLGLTVAASPCGTTSHKDRDKAGAKSATRVLLNDATFWRQYQSKSFQRHLTRQSQARVNQQKEKEKETKAIEYRYRRVPKPCYPLAKTSGERGPMEVEKAHLQTVQLPGVATRCAKSYVEQFNNLKQATDCETPPEKQGLLCGVYLHGKRRSHGMLYMTAMSLEQLKSRVAQKFSLQQPVVNLYSEQVATGLNGKRERKYLHRVAHFHELKDGDLLCATTNGYDDMAILCSWMKKRQQLIHHYSSPKKAPAQPPIKVAPSTKTVEQVKKTTPGDSLTYKPPSAPQVKLWDENGRLVSIHQRLSLAE